LEAQALKSAWRWVWVKAKVKVYVDQHQCAGSKSKDKQSMLINISVCIVKAGLFSSFFGEQRFDKVRESGRTLELFEQFDVQIQKWRILLVSVVILIQIMRVYCLGFM